MGKVRGIKLITNGSKWIPSVDFVNDMKRFGTLLESFMANGFLNRHKPGEASPAKSESHSRSASSIGEEKIVTTDDEPMDSLDNVTDDRVKVEECIQFQRISVETPLELESPTAEMEEESLEAMEKESSNFNRQRHPPYLVRRGGGAKYKRSLSTSTPTMVSVANNGDTCPHELLHDAHTDIKRFIGRETGEHLQDEDAATRLQAEELTLEEDKRSAEDWMNDEDLLFARLIVVRLRKLNTKDRRAVGTHIAKSL